MNDTPPAEAIDWQKGGGLVPAIVQDDKTGQVLMLGYMNAASYRASIKSRKVTFFSRSRQCLWQKGQSSGNVLHLVSIQIDCDQDTILVRARPAGPTCHLGTPSCFGDEGPQDLGWLGHLQGIITARKTADPKKSYTAQLLGGPVKRAAQKVGEEGVEVALAALDQTTGELIEESADLVYHLMVLLERRGASLDEVVNCLRARHESVK